MSRQYSPSYQKSEINPRVEHLEDAIPKPDLSKIESRDPSLVGGFKIIYNKEVPLDIKHETRKGTEDIAQFELIRCKLLTDALKEEDGPKRVKLELSWESDLLFHYTNILDENAFIDIKKEQKLNIDFSDYCNLVIRICEDCIKDPEIYLGELTILKDGISKLRFVKCSDFKDLELLKLECKNSSDEIIKKHMIYRFTYLKEKINYDKKVLKIAGDVILECNPDVMEPILERNDLYNLDVNKFFNKQRFENKK